jgi:hypothetical protein
VHPTSKPRPTPTQPPDKPDKPKHDKGDKPDKPKHDKSDKGHDKNHGGNHDNDQHRDKDKDKDKDHGSVPVPLAVGLAGWAATIRRRIARCVALAGAQIRGTARIRKKAKGGMNGPPRVGSERPAERSPARVPVRPPLWWRLQFGSCAPGLSTCIRHPT